MTKTTKTPKTEAAPKTKAKPKAKVIPMNKITSNNINALIARLLKKGLSAKIERASGEYYSINVSNGGKKKTDTFTTKIKEHATKAECDEAFTKAVEALV